MAVDGKGDGWVPDRDRVLKDTNPTTALNDFERRDWASRLTPGQIDVLLFVYQLAREYTDGYRDALERMPIAMGLLEHGPPLTASLFGKGREQVVDMLRKHKDHKPSIEAAISPIEEREEGGGDRGL